MITAGTEARPSPEGKNFRTKILKDLSQKIKELIDVFF
jgi:hypothetical protein